MSKDNSKGSVVFNPATNLYVWSIKGTAFSGSSDSFEGAFRACRAAIRDNQNEVFAS